MNQNLKSYTEKISKGSIMDKVNIINQILQKIYENTIQVHLVCMVSKSCLIVLGCFNNIVINNIRHLHKMPRKFLQCD